MATGGGPSRSAVVVPVAVYLFSCGLVFQQTPDDPWITLRFARNVVDGRGPVFNPDGQRVEGFTSLLHLIVDCLFVLVDGDRAILLAKLFGVACGAAVVVLLVCSLTRVTGRSGAGWAGGLLLAGGQPFAVSSVNGLETTLWALALLLLVEALNTRDLALRHVVPLVALPYLVRPESLVVVPLLCIAGQRDPGAAARPVRRLVATCLAMTALVSAARVLVFGSWLPTTVLAKSRPLDGRTFGAGLEYLGRVPLTVSWVHGHHAALAGVLFWAVCLLAARRCLVRAAAGARVHVVCVTAVAVIVVRAGGDWMAGGRFLAPVLPSLFWLLVVAAQDLRLPRPRMVTAAAPVAALVLVLEAQPQWGPPRRPFALQDRVLLTAGHAVFGPVAVAEEAVVGLCAQPGWSVAASELGYAAYTHLDVSFFDLRGLMTPAVARVPDSLKFTFGVTDPHELEASSPVGRLLVAAQPDLLMSFEPWDGGPVLGGGYRYAGSRAVGLSPLHVWVRDDHSCIL